MDAFRQDDGPFVVHLNTLPSNTYELQFSPDLADWDLVGQRVANTNLLEWVDPTATGQVQRFYRARRVTP